MPHFRLAGRPTLFAALLGLVVLAQQSFAADTSAAAAAYAALDQAVTAHPESAAPLLARAHQTYLDANVDTSARKAALVLEWSFFNDRGAAKLLPALADLDRAVQLEPGAAAPWIARGRVRLAFITLASDRKKGGFQPADTLADFQHALELEPNNASVWYDLGRTHLVVWTLQVKSILSGILPPKPEQVDARRNALLQAAAAFSRAIYLQPDTSGAAHFQRMLVLRDLTAANPDNHALLVDCSAAIAQDLSPSDPSQALVGLYDLDKEITSEALADLHYTRSRLLRGQGSINAALADLDAALPLLEVGRADFDINHGVKDFTREARFDRARLRVQHGDYDAALADFEVLLKEPRVPAPVWEWRALAHDGAGQIDAARADLEEGFKLDPKVRGRTAGTRYDAQNPNPARGIAPRPVKSDIHTVPPGTPLEHKNAGNARRGEGDKDAAIREYNLALAIDPEFADALNNRAGLYNERRLDDLALADFNHAITVDPKHRAAYLNRGLMWRRLGDAQKERDDLDHAVEFANPDALRASAYGARFLTRSYAGDAPGALADAQRATELAPTDPAAWIALGHLHADAKDYDAAASNYRQAITIKEGSWEAHADLAIVLALQNDAAAAGAELHTALGWSHSEEFDQIRDLLDRVIKANPDSAPLRTLKQQLDTEETERTTFKV